LPEIIHDPKTKIKQNNNIKKQQQQQQQQNPGNLYGTRKQQRFAIKKVQQILVIFFKGLSTG
jgi:hypothetical protein